MPNYERRHGPFLISFLYCSFVLCVCVLRKLSMVALRRSFVVILSHWLLVSLDFRVFDKQFASQHENVMTSEYWCEITKSSQVYVCACMCVIIVRMYITMRCLCEVNKRGYIECVCVCIASFTHKTNCEMEFYVDFVVNVLSHLICTFYNFNKN